MAKLKSAWTVHLASVRNRFFDHLDTAAIGQVADALSTVAAHLENGSPQREALGLDRKSPEPGDRRSP